MNLLNRRWVSQAAVECDSKNWRHLDRNFSSLLLIPSDSCYIVYVRLPGLRFFRAFSSVVRQMPGYNPQRRGTAHTLPNFYVVLCIFCVVLCIVWFVTFSVLCVCICVPNYCHRVATQLQLNVSYHIISYHIISYHIISYHIIYSVAAIL